MCFFLFCAITPAYGILLVPSTVTGEVTCSNIHGGMKVLGTVDDCEEGRNEDWWGQYKEVGGALHTVTLSIMGHLTVSLLVVQSTL